VNGWEVPVVLQSFLRPLAMRFSLSRNQMWAGSTGCLAPVSFLPTSSKIPFLPLPLVCILFIHCLHQACFLRARTSDGAGHGAQNHSHTHTHRSHTMEEDLGAIFKNPKTNSRWELPATPRWAPHPMVRTAQSKRSDKTRCLTFCHALSSTGVDKKLKQRGQKVKQRVCGPPPGQKLCPTRGILGLHC
jgi:hypothetical protein